MNRFVFIVMVAAMMLPWGLKAAEGQDAIESAEMWTDEGMWLIQDINEALEKKMQERGLQLSAGEIYNADAPGAAVSDAVVSLGFYCSASIISDKGLMITNHHCAYSDIFEMSTPDHNYLEEGYWAVRSDQELPIPGKQAFFLKRVLDVTAEVKALKSEMKIDGKPFGMRRLSGVMEKKYKEETGKEAFLSSMWSGEKFYIALYDVYTDLRLVAAPPVSVAAFGGDVDNWEWPQHKCDFAMYRIYTAPDGSPAEYSEKNVPLRPLRKLEISLDGYKPGDFTMVIGYPGSTNRYSSSMEADYEQNLALPIANSLRTGQMEIMSRWMKADPEVWLKYSDTFFGLSNLGEMQQGEEACLRRFKVIEEKQAEEQELQRWIEADAGRMARWGTLLRRLKEKYDSSAWVERNKAYYRETLFRGTIIGRTIMRMNSTKGGYDGMKRFLDKGMAETDPRVERELLELAVSQYFSNVDSSFFGPYQKKLLSMFGDDFSAMTDYIWEGTFVSSPEKAATFTDESQFAEDRLHLLIHDINILKFNKCQHNQELRNGILSLHKEYTHALYEMRAEKGEPQYPDANSTMRITYGVVADLEPHDGIVCSWQSTAAGVCEKYNPDDRDFRPSDDYMTLLQGGDWGKFGCEQETMGKGRGRKAQETAYMPVNFLTDNDITGGNSGSPVLNSKGQLIGLAFDGNKESLASDLSSTPGYNKCVCVDIRYILWVLQNYGHMDRITEELGL